MGLQPVWVGHGLAMCKASAPKARRSVQPIGVLLEGNRWPWWMTKPPGRPRPSNVLPKHSKRTPMVQPQLLFSRLAHLDVAKYASGEDMVSQLVVRIGLVVWCFPI